MRQYALAAILTFASTPFVHAAVPAGFTVQGSLKQNDAPLHGTHSMEFRITNASGTTTYWTSGTRNIQVVDGVYRVELAPTIIDWANITPYIETNVGGVTLLPREKLASTIYARVAESAQSLSSGSSSMRAYPDDLRFSVAGSLRLILNAAGNYSNNPLAPNGDNMFKLGWTTQRWTDVFATGGVVTTHSYKQQRDIKELVVKKDGFSLVSVDSSSAPNQVQSIKNLTDLKIPRAIMFKWKSKLGNADDKDVIGFAGFDLPEEARAILEDGTRDPENYYTNAVIGIMLAKMRQMELRIAELEPTAR